MSNALPNIEPTRRKFSHSDHYFYVGHSNIGEVEVRIHEDGFTVCMADTFTNRRNRIAGNYVNGACTKTLKEASEAIKSLVVTENFGRIVVSVDHRVIA